jgi:hypothetical protein
VQIGTFSHDQARDGGPPNGVFDLEDPTYQNKPDQLSMYDRGLNGRAVADKFYLIPNASQTGWDTLSRTRNTNLLTFPRGVDNPSGDIYRRYDKDNIGNFRWANGTWGNSVFDSENIDSDGIPRVNYKEKYFSYTIDLSDTSSVYIDNSARLESGWYFYRIPIKELLKGASVVKDSAAGGAPDWSKVRGMRLVWYDFDQTTVTSEQELRIAGVELVGNNWESAPGFAEKIEPNEIFNYEDIDYYNSVYNKFAKPKSSDGGITPEERSLRLRLTNLSPGDTALVRKNNSYSPQNISGYDSLSVQVYNNGGRAYGDDLKFVFRFGSDDSTYYEYAAPLNKNKEWARFAFKLQAFSDLKDAAEAKYGTGAFSESSGPLRVVASAGRRPNFTAITYMAVGVASGANVSESEIWVNELVAVGPRKQNGVAARVNLSTQWADFLSLSAGISYTDGSFRTMTESLAGEDRSELSANVSAKLSADKFMPAEWGVSIPVGGSVSGTLSRPTVKPQSDIILLKDDGTPDGLFDMAGDAFDLFFGREGDSAQTRAERYQTFSTTRNAYTSFEKTSESENPFVNFSLDRIKTDIGYNMTASYTGKGPQEHPDSADYFRTDTTTTYTGNLSYDLSPRNPPEWTSVSPLSEAKWAPSIYKDYTFNLLPSTINFDLIQASHRTEKRDDPKLNVHDFETRTFDLRHGVNVEYSPIDPLLSFGYGLRWDRDISDLPVTEGWDAMMDSAFANIFGLNSTEGHKWDKYSILYGEKSRSQSASMRLAPQFVRWMTHSAEYSADYSGQLVRRDVDSVQYMNANVVSALRFKNTLLVADLFKGLSEGADSGFWSMMNKNVAKIGMRSIVFEYDANTDLKNSYLSSTFLADTAGLDGYEYLKYQLGLRRNFSDYFWGRVDGKEGLGQMFYRDGLGGSHDLYRYDQSMGSWSARFSTAFAIPAPVKINFSNISLSWGREFYAQPDTNFIDTTAVLPDVRVSANTDALEKIPLVLTHLSKLGLTSSFGYKASRKETKDRTDTTTTVDFQPLFSLDGKFKKWPTLTATYRFGMSGTRIVSGGKGESAGVLSTENTNKNSHTFNIGYEFSTTGRFQEIKLGKWAIPIQGKTNVGLAINWEKTDRETIIGDGEPQTEDNYQLDYSPYIEYRFTDNIKGQARYLGSHKNQNGMLTMQQRFALTAEVVF